MAETRSKRFTRTEKSWIMYDWANSVYAIIIMAAIYPIYFTGIMASAGGDGDVWWGYATSLATLATACLAPFLGAIGDFRGMKKKLFTAFLILGVAFTTVMGLTDNWKLMLAGYVLSYIGFAGSLLFYDSFLTDITTADRMDRVSAWGYAMGYLGGSTIPFLVSIALLLAGDSFGIDDVMAVKISCILCSVWWAVFSIPFLRRVRQTHYEDKPARALIAGSLRNIRRTLADIIGNKAILVFMVAYFFYIDGVNTVIHMATAYGSALGLGREGMILALMVTQLVAVPFSILFSKLSGKLGSIRLISIAIVVYFIICSVGFYMGFSLEPSQQAYTNQFNETVRSSMTEAGRQLSPASREQLAADLDTLLEQAEGILAADDRAAQTGDMFDDLLSAADSTYADSGEANAARAALAAIAGSADEFLKNERSFADFAKALKRSEILFWAMAVLVGTCQGGIQALSRSFFGKLIPPNRSNEFYGFFDIFGKFAAVVGPALYALVANLTGRSSYGILSLMLLFAIGLLTIAVGRRYLRQAEDQASEAVRLSLGDPEQ